MSDTYDNDTIDRHAKQLHAAALAHVSPQTLAKLRSARHATAQPAHSRHGWRWIVATACSAVLAVAIGVQFLPRTSKPIAPVQPVVAAGAAAASDYSTSLDENPDLYVWLASADGQRLASE